VRPLSGATGTSRVTGTCDAVKPWVRTRVSCESGQLLTWSRWRSPSLAQSSRDDLQRVPGSGLPFGLLELGQVAGGEMTSRAPSGTADHHRQGSFLVPAFARTIYPGLLRAADGLILYFRHSC
jgi:hypothetical protein